MTTSTTVLKTASPSQIRDELEQLVLGELLGPAGGPQEELTDRPRDRYLVGILAPKKQRLTPEQDGSPPLVPDVEDEPTERGVDGRDEGPPDASVAQIQIPLLSPSSLGMTCCVSGEATEIVITANWGSYTRTRSETVTSRKTGELVNVWKRQQMGGSSVAIQVQEGDIAAFSPDPLEPEVRVRGRIRRSGDDWLVTLWLLNEQDEPDSLRDTAWVFQPELSVAAPDGSSIFRRRAGLAPQIGDVVAAAEDRSLQMQYRHHIEFAVGHGVSVHAEVQDEISACATRIETRVIPVHEVRATTSADETDFPLLKGMELDMRELSAIPDGEFGEALRPLIAGYHAWIRVQEARITDPSTRLAEFEATAREALDKCREARTRIEAGITLLNTNLQAAQAFRFMNRAMWQQRIHTRRIEEGRGGEMPTLEQVDIPRNRSWRLFQLAFILLNIPALTDLSHADRSDDPTAITDLLWFPTGGGKTEAYLGLTAFTLAIRRLQGTVAGRSGLDGIAVLMRYTLRLLTLQQFQRAAALIAACELIRRSDPRTWGTTAFRLGLWVGQAATPN